MERWLQESGMDNRRNKEEVASKEIVGNKELQVYKYMIDMIG